MDAQLARFFAHWVPFLRGQRDLSELQGALGPARSRPPDLSFYRTLVERNAAAILSAVYPATRAACIAWLPGQWRRAVACYEREHPATSYNPNELGRNFPSFLRRFAASSTSSSAHGMRFSGDTLTVEDGQPTPEALEELADYEWLLCALGAGIPAEVPSAGAPESYVVRQYARDVPDLATQLRAAHPAGASARDQPVTVLLYRDRHTGHARALYPSRAALFALARRANLRTRHPQQAESVEALDAAERELIALGALDTPAPTPDRDRAESFSAIRRFVAPER